MPRLSHLGDLAGEQDQTATTRSEPARGRRASSGNVSWLVRTSAGDFFVKSAGAPGAPPPGAPVPYLDHAGRVRLLRTAVDLARSSDHDCLPPLRNVVETGQGPLLVYQRAAGELIGTTRSRRTDPTGAYQRFAQLPAERLLGVVDDLIDLHRDLAGAGWVAGDLPADRARRRVLRDAGGPDRSPASRRWRTGRPVSVCGGVRRRLAGGASRSG